MNLDTRDTAAGAVGGLVAGAVLSGIMLLLERSGRGPSDLVLTERRGARELDVPHRRMRAAPDMGEQAAGHAAHRPLGSIMRTHMNAYAALGGARRRNNGHPTREPRGISEVPD